MHTLLTVLAAYSFFIILVLATKNFGGRGLLPFVKLVAVTVADAIVQAARILAGLVLWIGSEIVALHKQFLFGTEK
jgi:hypothetical protein